MMDHNFNVTIAKKFDVNVAIFIQNIAFWIQKNIANERHFYEGRFWTYNSLNAFSDLFPYWTVDQLRTIIKKCIKNDLIIVGNFNKSTYDRTQWFSLTDVSLSFYPCIWENYQIKLGAIRENSQMDSEEFPNGFGENPTPIPDSKQQIIKTYTIDNSINFDHLKTLETQELEKRVVEHGKDKFKRLAIENERCKKVYEEGWKDIDCTISEAYDACQSYWETKDEIANWGRFKSFLENQLSKNQFKDSVSSSVNPSKIETYEEKMIRWGEEKKIDAAKFTHNNTKSEHGAKHSSQLLASLKLK